MKPRAEPDFNVHDYVTITKDVRIERVVTLGGTAQAADIV